jgi:predicted DCC family thiol-disulfide oxidoreductase YuxK
VATSAGVLIYDGDCAFCTSCARWIERRWPDGGPSAVPWQRLGAQLGELGLDEAQVLEAAWWVDDDGPARGEVAIARALAATSNPTWRSLGRLLQLPSIESVTAPIYRTVVRHRHRLPGSSAACRIDERR